MTPAVCRNRACIRKAENIFMSPRTRKVVMPQIVIVHDYRGHGAMFTFFCVSALQKKRKTSYSSIATHAKQTQK